MQQKNVIKILNDKKKTLPGGSEGDKQPEGENNI